MAESFLSPKGIQETYQIGRSTAYKLLSEYEKSGGEVLHIGTLTRVSGEKFTQFLRTRNEKKS
jgi:transposase